ncbi:protein GVQW3-like [Aethina tumida]|uniref:protein GVQW3-like n=1 Tax=Aethina tumida TaxID=116153 RepID=UPI00214908ED|nr:protein GVQW3-like [Aethina tumida]
MEKIEFRVVIKHCFLMGKNTVEAQQRLEKHYPDSSPSKPMICRWYTEFKRGRTDTNNAERPGRPLEAVSPENVSEVLKIIMINRKVKVREIAEMTQISSGSVFTILHEKLSRKKVFPHPPYLPDLAPNDYWLFADLKKMLQGRKFGSNEEVIAETESYLEAKDKSFYKHGIEMLERRWNDCITLKVDYIDEQK